MFFPPHNRRVLIMKVSPFFLAMSRSSSLFPGDDSYECALSEDPSMTDHAVSRLSPLKPPSPPLFFVELLDEENFLLCFAWLITLQVGCFFG